MSIDNLTSLYCTFFLCSELETQIKEIVGRIGAGHGLPWPKPVALKTIASDERSRVALIRLLELRLGVRKQTNLLLSANGEIVPVVSTKQSSKDNTLSALKFSFIGFY